jgi:LmbE family N-acetylglucosaminyl deacetylase
MNKILVIASHPDDQILGCGATFHKYIMEGNEIYCLILGEGMTSRQGDDINLDYLEECTKKANDIIGFKKTYWNKLPDNKFDSIPLLDIVQIIEQYINLINPITIFTQAKGDLNIDHQLTFKASLTACRPNYSTVKEIYCFETLSSTEWAFDGSFKPNVFAEITYPELDTKIKALQCYTTEIRPYPHPRSAAGLRAHAEFYGVMAGVEYAEAFELVRKVG